MTEDRLVLRLRLCPPLTLKCTPRRVTFTPSYSVEGGGKGKISVSRKKIQSTGRCSSLRCPSRNGRRLVTSSETPGEGGCCLGRLAHPEPPGQWGGAQNWEALLGSHCSSLTMEGSLLAPLMNSSRDSLPGKEKGGLSITAKGGGLPAPDGQNSQKGPLRVFYCPTAFPGRPSSPDAPGLLGPSSPTLSFDQGFLQRCVMVLAELQQR